VTCCIELRRAGDLASRCASQSATGARCPTSSARQGGVINRYTLQVQHGWLFTQLPLGRAVARAFARHLYADEPFLFGDDPAESPENLRRDFSLQR
jgi:hypothetical protein